MPKPPQDRDSGCPAEEKLVLYAEKALSEEERAKIVDHLVDCDECRSIAASLHKGELDTGQLEEQANRPVEPRPSWTSESVPSGTKLGRYVIIQMVGEGGMGEVYSAYDPELDRKVALKLVHAEFFEEPDDPAGSRLLREAQAMAKLSHPNVLSVYDVQSIEGDLAIAMEFIEGMTLSRWCKAEKRTWKEVLKMYIHAGEGLNAAHQAGLVHRDFKPDNVLVRKDGRVFVTDFGLVRQANEEGKALGDRSMLVVRKEKVVSQKALKANLTKTGTLMGTPAYMAPEQLQGQEVDARADQYSFFVSLYEGLFGERPIEAKSLEEYQKLTSSKEIVVPKKSDVPHWLRAIVRKGLSKEPEKRFGSMGEVLTALRNERAKRRRSALIAICLVLATAIGTAFAARINTRAKFHCEVPIDEFVGIWDDTIRAKIGEAFAKSGVKYASEINSRILAQLDSYQQDWRKVFIESCRDTHMRQLYSVDILGRRVDCLRKLKESFRTLAINLSAQVDHRVINNALNAVYDLPQIKSCSDVKALLSEQRDSPEQAGPMTKPQIQSLKITIEEISTLDKLGKYKEGLVLARNTQEKAKRLGYLPLLAETTYWLGALLEKNGDYKSAEQILTDAAHRYGFARDVDGYTKSLERLAYTIGVRQERFDDGLRIAQSLEDPTLGKVGTNELVLAKCFNTVGSLYSQHQKPGQAIPRFQKSIALLEKNLGPTHPTLAEPIMNLGTAYVRASNFAESYRLHLRALQIYEKASGPQHPSVANALLAIANDRVGSEQLADALNDATRALRIMRVTLGEDNPLLAKALFTIGYINYRLDKNNESYKSYQEGLDIAVKGFGKENSLTVWLHYGLGNTLFEMKRFQDADEHYRQFLDSAKQSRDFDDGVAFVLYNQAKMIVLQGGSSRRAAEYANLAIQYYESRGIQSHTDQAKEIREWKARSGI